MLFVVVEFSTLVFKTHMPEQITLGSTTAARQVVGLNMSLLKGGTISQTIGKLLYNGENSY